MKTDLIASPDIKIDLSEICSKCGEKIEDTKDLFCKDCNTFNFRDNGFVVYSMYNEN